jgi:hypothetical protein
MPPSEGRQPCLACGDEHGIAYDCQRLKRDQSPSEKPLTEVVREACEQIWPWLTDRSILTYKIKSKQVRGRTKLTLELDVEVVRL